MRPQLSSDEDLRIEADFECPDYARLVKVAREIQALGYDLNTSIHFARLIGPKPERDSAGLIIVKEHGRDLARLNLGRRAATRLQR